MEKTNEKKIYHSIDEVEMDFFPNLYRRHPEGRRRMAPGTFGSKLAEEFIEDIKRELAKNHEC